MGKTPLISILVPVYNAEKFLASCLDSILIQTYSNFEVICVNDGSIDKSEQILKDYSAKDPRVKYYTTVNQGVGHARNVLLEKSLGEYITFVDADDMIVPEYLQNLYQAMSQTDADMVRCTWKESRQGKLFPAGCSSKRNQSFGEEPAQRILAGYYDSIVWGKLIKTRFVKENNLAFFEGAVAEDLSFAILLFVFAGGIISVDTPLYIYQRDNVNAITTRPNKMYLGRLANMLYVWKFLSNKGKISPQGSQICIRLILWQLSSLRKLDNSYMQQALELYQKAIDVISAEILPHCSKGWRLFYRFFLRAQARLPWQMRLWLCKAVRSL